MAKDDFKGYADRFDKAGKVVREIATFSACPECGMPMEVTRTWRHEKGAKGTVYHPGPVPEGPRDRAVRLRRGGGLDAGLQPVRQVGSEHPRGKASGDVGMTDYLTNTPIMTLYDDLRAEPRHP